MICSHSCGSLAAIRVTSRSPGPARARCASGTSVSVPAVERRHQLRQVGDAGHRGVVLLDVHHDLPGAAGAGPGPGRRRRCAGADRRCGVITQVRSANRSARAANGPECWEPAIGCEPTYRARSGWSSQSAARTPAFTDPTSVTVAVGKSSRARPIAAPRVRGEHSDDDERDRFAGRLVGRAGTEPGRDPGMTAHLVAEMDAPAGGGQGEADRGADQAGTDHHRLATRGCVHRTGLIGGCSRGGSRLGRLVGRLSAGCSVGCWADGSPPAESPAPSTSSAASRSPRIRRNLRGSSRVRSRTATSSASTPSLAAGALVPPSAASARTASRTAVDRSSPWLKSLLDRLGDGLGRPAHHGEIGLVLDRAVVGQPVDLVQRRAQRRARRRRSPPRTASPHRRRRSCRAAGRTRSPDRDR